MLVGTVAENYVHLRMHQKPCEKSKIQTFPGGILPDLPRCHVFIYMDLNIVAPLLLWNLISPPLSHFLDEGLLHGVHTGLLVYEIIMVIAS